MKKKNTIKKGAILLFSGLVLMLMGCQSLKESTSPYQEADINKDKQVLFQVSDSSQLRTEQLLEVEIRNNTEREITYGIAYSLEKRTDNQWMTFSPYEEKAFIEIALGLKPGEVGDEVLDVSGYPSFSNGTYRVIRVIEGHPYAAEFELK